MLFGPKPRPRDEAILWLSVAAEIEHALMAQYLFAAYSVDPEAVPAANQSAARSIKDRLLQIAREEMGHFVTVQNLLHIVGGPLHFGRQFSPFEHAVQPFRYRLEALSLDSIAKYVIAESPNRPLSELTVRPTPAEDEAIKRKITEDIAPRARRSNGGVDLWHVGSAFKRLGDLFRTELADSDLRVDRPGYQAQWSDWGFESRPGTDGGGVLVDTIDGTTPAQIRQQASDAIQRIGDQGEAFDQSVTDMSESHFERFLDLYERVEALEATLGRPLALPVAPNPNTSPPPLPTRNVPLSMGSDHLDAGRITNDRSLRWAHLFNLRYHVLLGCLHHSLLLDTAPYDASGDRTPKGLLQYWTFAEMRRLKKIAEKLVELPVGEPTSLRAGAPFELPYSLRLPHIDTDRWAAHADQFAAAKDYIEQDMLVVGENAEDFLRFVAEADGRAAAIADALARGMGVPPGTHAAEFRKAVHILEEAVRGFEIGARHSSQGMFWRRKTRDEFVATAPIAGATPIVPGKPDESELVLRIERPQSDTSGGMPRQRPRIPPSRRGYVREWIERGAPDSTPSGEQGILGEPIPSRGPTAAPPAPPPSPAKLSFEQDVRPLFRNKDRNCMLARFDLFKHDDVKMHAQAIYESVESGFMPFDGPWTAEKVVKFKKWIDDGLLA
jgi:hypothetical protein